MVRGGPISGGLRRAPQVEEALGTALCHIGNKKLFTCSLETTNTGVITTTDHLS